MEAKGKTMEVRESGKRMFVDVTAETRAWLMKTFGCSSVMLSYALHYNAEKGRSKLAQKIRKAACEKGGVVYVVEKAAMQTVHDCEGKMRQYLPNGVVLELDKLTGGADLIVNGEVAKHWDDVKVADIVLLQREAANYFVG